MKPSRARGGRRLTERLARVAAEARACGCARGGDLDRDAAFARGVDETRRKVRELNELVVKELVARGVNARGVSPSAGGEGWETRGPGTPASTSTSNAARDAVFELCSNGIVPVIHGDVVRDAVQGTSVLSGDDIVAWCARWVADANADANAPPPRVVFCSDVFGVYAGPPKTSVIVDSDEYDVPLRVSEDEDAVLLRDIVVADADGSWRCVSASPLAALNETLPSTAVPTPTFTVADGVDDVTGGVEAKLASAVAIASSLPPTPEPLVFLARAGAFRSSASAPARNHALDAILGRPSTRDDDDDDDGIDRFVGTRIRRLRAST